MNGFLGEFDGGECGGGRLTEALQGVLLPIPMSDMVIAASDAAVVEAETSPVLMTIAVDVELG